MLPIVNAITVTTVTPSLVLPKREKFGVAVPPLMNEPMDGSDAAQQRHAAVDLSKMATRPPPSIVAVTME